MKARHIALALLLAAVPCLHAGPEGEPSGGEPHLYYSNGYYFTDPEQHHVYTGDYREYYPNGTLRLEVSIKNGTPEGTYVIYFDNRRPHEVRSYRDGKLHGTWRTYDRSGQLLSEAEYRNLARSLQQRDRDEARMKGLIASRFDIVDRLGKTLYERENTVSGQAVMTREVKRIIEGFAENGDMLQELEHIVDMAHDGVMRKLRRNFPKMKESDVRLLCYIFGGFSPQVISLFMEENVANVYARKSRLKSRIKASDAPDRELFLTLLGTVSERC